MIQWVVYISVVGILIYFAYRGLQRGLVLSAFGAVALLAALIGANIAANAFPHRMEVLLEPLINNGIDTHARTLTFFTAFFLIWLALRMVTVLLDTLAQLPVLHYINKICGAVCGVVQGVIVVWLGALALQYIGWISANALGGSFIQRFLV
jgi:uncharacterized membrane protein required for colicin V production